MNNMLNKYDLNLIKIKSGNGYVFVSPGLQGRIFCEIDDELMHRLDGELLASPLDEEFNNLGGNSLWPAPEGGAFAFNYMPGSDEWLVQPGIANMPYDIDEQDTASVKITKTVELNNRKGINCHIKCSRMISSGSESSIIPVSQITPLGLQWCGYSCRDVLEPVETVTPKDMLLAAWSLEQFPGGEDVTAFVKVVSPRSAINFDFYGMPKESPTLSDNYFLLNLGGESRFQIGVATGAEPLLLGALDRRRGCLILRQTKRQQGVYFNIADNDQEQGAFSAADMYSIFSGGELNFFELETIGAMNVKNGYIKSCELISETLIIRGATDELVKFIASQWGIIV